MKDTSSFLVNIVLKRYNWVDRNKDFYEELFLKNGMKMNHDTIDDCDFDENKCWLVEEVSKTTNRWSECGKT